MSAANAIYAKGNVKEGACQRARETVRTQSSLEEAFCLAGILLFVYSVSAVG